MASFNEAFKMPLTGIIENENVQNTLTPLRGSYQTYMTKMDSYKGNVDIIKQSDLKFYQLKDHSN
jgi:hypothetical protein|tara:strand:- start:624 stop:818 length:195 start_codon:yes stop_codon:yes gene_type:complete